MCQHHYTLIKTKIVRIGTHFSKREVTTEYFQCEHCGKTTFVKKELILDKFEIPLITILDNLN